MVEARKLALSDRFTHDLGFIHQTYQRKTLIQKLSNQKKHETCGIYFLVKVASASSIQRFWYPVLSIKGANCGSMSNGLHLEVWFDHYSWLSNLSTQHWLSQRFVNYLIFFNKFPFCLHACSGTFAVEQITLKLSGLHGLKWGVRHWHNWNFRPDNSWLCRAVLCPVGCSAATPVPTHYMPGTAPPQVVTTKKNVSRHCQYPLETKSPSAENHWLKTTIKY